MSRTVEVIKNAAITTNNWQTLLSAVGNARVVMIGRKLLIFQFQNINFYINR